MSRKRGQLGPSWRWIHTTHHSIWVWLTLFIPKLTSYFKIYELCLDKNCYFTFYPLNFVVMDQVTHTPLPHRVYDGRLYRFSGNFTPHIHVAEKVSLDGWHHRLDHPHEAVIHCLVSSSLLPLPSNVFNKCAYCLVGKSKRHHLYSTFAKSTKPLDLIHSDVWGMVHISSFYGDRYFVIFIDDISHYIWLFSIKHKFDVFSIFIPKAS